MLQCNHCNRSFATKKGFNLHHRLCFNRITELNQKNIFNSNVLPTNDALTGISVYNSQLITQNESDSEPDLIDMNIDNDAHTIDAEYMVCVELLALLQKAKCPLYMFNKIMNWARRANTFYQYKFHASKNGINRENILKTITTKFDQTGMMPNTTPLYLSGLKSNVEVVWHDFEHCLYSLLRDKDLMNPDNLLLFNNRMEKNIFDDVNSGQVFTNAKKFI
jgi:hypothetical protein